MADDRARLRRWRTLTIGLMFTGYCGDYPCRSNLSVALPQVTDEPVAAGVSPPDARVMPGTVVSVGMFGYALGEFASGFVADTLGGRRNFLVGMAGSAACTCFRSDRRRVARAETAARRDLEAS